MAIMGGCRTLRSALLALACVSAAACGDDGNANAPSRTPAGTLRLQGRVTDFASGAPLANLPLAFGTDVQAFDRVATTDAAGFFSIAVPEGRIRGAIDGVAVAEFSVHRGNRAYRGDLLADAGSCVSRYGVVSDAVTYQPVAGATVRLGGRTMVTGADGWYRIDLGCDLDPLNNFGTALMYATHPAYRDFSRVVGRGIHRVNRIDLELVRP